MQFPLEQLLRRKLRQVLGYADACGFQLKQPNLFLLLRMQRIRPSGGPSSVCVLFSSTSGDRVPSVPCRRPESSDLQVDGDQPPQPPMKEKQIEIVILVIHGDSLLASDEREVRAELQEEPLQFPQDGIFQILLAVSLGQPEKIEEVRITKDKSGVTRSSSRSAAISLRATCPGFLLIAVRS